MRMRKGSFRTFSQFFLDVSTFSAEVILRTPQLLSDPPFSFANKEADLYRGSWVSKTQP